VTKSLKTVARLRADVEHHVRWWPSNALGTAQEAVATLERLVAADPSEVFALLDELRGSTATDHGR
jgi:hypothetical protein